MVTEYCFDLFSGSCEAIECLFSVQIFWFRRQFEYRTGFWLAGTVLLVKGTLDKPSNGGKMGT